MSTLYFIRGVSGAGKSTLARQLQDSGIVQHHFEADMWMTDAFGNYHFNADNLAFAHSMCRSETRDYLLRGDSVVVSNTSTTEKEVEPYRKIAEDCGAQFVSIIVENRSGTKSVHDVPEETLEKQRKRFSVKL